MKSSSNLIAFQNQLKIQFSKNGFESPNLIFATCFEETFGRFYRVLRFRFFDFLIKNGEFEVLKLVIPLNGSGVVLSDEIAPQLSAYLKAYPGDFCALFPNYNLGFRLDEIEQWKFLLNLGLNQEQMNLVFEREQEYGAKALEIVCSRTDSSYLLALEIQIQVLFIYNFLNTVQKSLVELLLRYRSLLSSEEIDPTRVPDTNSEFMAIVLGPQRDLILNYFSGVELLNVVNIAVEYDESVLDWLISKFYRSLMNRLPSSNNSNLPSDAEFMLIHRKILVYCKSGHTDFLRHLAESPVNSLNSVVDILSYFGTPQEFEIF